MTQNQQILQALTEGKHLTAIVALTEYRCFRLASRINDLRNAGHNIATTMEDLPNGKRIASYTLIKKAASQ